MLANWSASMGVASDKPYLTDHNFPLPEPRGRRGANCHIVLADLHFSTCGLQVRFRRSGHSDVCTMSPRQLFKITPTAAAGEVEDMLLSS